MPSANFLLRTCLNLITMKLLLTFTIRHWQLLYNRDRRHYTLTSSSWRTLRGRARSLSLSLSISFSLSSLSDRLSGSQALLTIITTNIRLCSSSTPLLLPRQLSSIPSFFDQHLSFTTKYQHINTALNSRHLKFESSTSPAQNGVYFSVR